MNDYKNYMERLKADGKLQEKVEAKISKKEKSGGRFLPLVGAAVFVAMLVMGVYTVRVWQEDIIPGAAPGAVSDYAPPPGEFFFNSFTHIERIFPDGMDENPDVQITFATLNEEQRSRVFPNIDLGVATDSGVLYADAIPISIFMGTGMGIETSSSVTIEIKLASHPEEEVIFHGDSADVSYIHGIPVYAYMRMQPNMYWQTIFYIHFEINGLRYEVSTFVRYGFWSSNFYHAQYLRMARTRLVEIVTTLIENILIEDGRPPDLSFIYELEPTLLEVPLLEPPLLEVPLLQPPLLQPPPWHPVPFPEGPAWFPEEIQSHMLAILPWSWSIEERIIGEPSPRYPQPPMTAEIILEIPYLTPDGVFIILQHELLDEWPARLVVTRVSEEDSYFFVGVTDEPPTDSITQGGLGNRAWRPSSMGREAHLAITLNGPEEHNMYFVIGNLGTETITDIRIRRILPFNAPR